MKKRKNIFRCPKVFTIYNNRYRDDSLAFINSLELIEKNNITEATISFFSCVEIKAAAMVMLKLIFYFHHFIVMFRFY